MLKSVVKRGRPAKVVTKVETRGRKKTEVIRAVFNPDSVKLFRGSELHFKDELFRPMKTNSEIDVILSSDGGLMPGTNMILVGGPGSGKTTVALDVVSSLTQQGFKCLFVSGEMDEIGYYKYCKRIPKFSCVQTLFLKNYHENVKETLEYVFSEGYDVVVIDSIAEVLEMVKDTYNVSYGAAESWFLSLQDKNKKGDNKNNYYTTFVNIQQVTKAGDFTGSNRLKHMTEAMAHIDKNKDGTERSIHFSKNRDCDKDFKLYFSISSNVHYTYEQIQD
jgi:predicted ATP-dependent serine protease